MIRSRWIRCACVGLVGGAILAGASISAGAAPVEELTKRLPDGVVGFVATSGGEALKEDLAKTSLGRICNDPGVRSFAQTIATQLLAKAQEKGGGPNDIKQLNMALNMVRSVAARPFVLGVAPAKGPVQAKELPPVYAFAILDAGTHKADLEAVVKTLETLAGAQSIADVNVGPAKMRGPKAKPPVSVYWGWSGDYFVVAANDAAGAALQNLQKPRGAAPEYLKKVPAGGDALVVHADIQKALALVDAVVRPKDAKVADTVSAVLKDLGLSGVRSFTSRVGFAGPDLVAGSFLEVPGPHTGLLTMLKPVDPALMDLVDARAVTAGAANIDAAGAYDTILHAVKDASGAAGVNIEQGLTAFESEAKFSIRQGLLGSLAGPVVHYSLGMGAVPEAPMGGLVVLVKLKDADLFEKTMTSLGDFAAAQSKGAFQVSAQKREDGRVVHSWTVAQLAMMQVMPTWSIGNGYAIIGLNPGVYEAAVKQMAATGADRKSIRDTPGYKEVASQLPAGVVCLDYADSRTQYTQAMVMFQQFWPMAGLFAAQAGIKLPPALPSLSDIIKDMKPMFRSRWVAADGVYDRYQGPGVEVGLSAVAGGAVGAAVALPAMAKSRDQARNMVVMSNLKQIGLALHMYAQEHQGEWPTDLEQVKSYLAPSILESPRKPKDFSGPSYIYVPGQPKTPDPHNVMVYENPAYCTEKIDVLFADGHVEAMKPDAFRKELKATYDRLGKPMPEIKFKGETEVKPRAPRPSRPARAPQT